jgi:hypothetical protein
MITPGRHRLRVPDAWNELAAQPVIEEIVVADAIAQFHPGTFWPTHPCEDAAEDGNPSFLQGRGRWRSCDLSFSARIDNLGGRIKPLEATIIDQRDVRVSAFQQPVDLAFTEGQLVIPRQIFPF